MGKKRALKLMRKTPNRSEGERQHYFAEKAKAMDVQAKTKPKSKKAKKIIERKEYILQNDPKHSLFIRGNNISQQTKQAMLELHKMRDLHISQCLLQKKNNIQPFEDASYIEHVADRHDAGFILFGSHNKKRPNNMIVNRMYNHQVLDIMEVGVDSCIEMSKFKEQVNIEVGQQPIILFQGEQFDLQEKHMKFKNMMWDFFRIKHLHSVNILASQRIITFTAQDNEGSI
mmetsp:Transcript_25047/g.27769  ORF Transcript_25047/g.27769 Transcript_25047/m.27769 type:complete len:229 (+) Transcript_25047:3-689(+)